MNTTKKKPPGVVLYDGPSRIDGKPIVVIATFASKNKKTGNVIQTWILRKNINPIRAINTGADRSVCGECPLRGTISRVNRKPINVDNGCYVQIGKAPRSVWQSYQNGNYPDFERVSHVHLFADRVIRLGSYGDPVAAPLSAWKPLLSVSAGWTGYTHQWRDRRFRRWSKYIMASTHTLDDNDLARNYGFRWFRSGSDGIGPGEIMCPASAEAGSRLTCEQCLACSGGRASQVSVYIQNHGSAATMKAFGKATR
jgi:hypothetical protein